MHLPSEKIESDKYNNIVVTNSTLMTILYAPVTCNKTHYKATYTPQLHIAAIVLFQLDEIHTLISSCLVLSHCSVFHGIDYIS